MISATNKEIDQMIADGQFRKDLYFRLGVIKVKAPSLNERPDDIIPLTKYFLQEFSRKFGKKFTGISSEAETVLLAHNWTGHVRELKNLIERAVLTGKGTELSPTNLGLEEKYQGEPNSPNSDKTRFPPLPAEGLDLDVQLQSFEKHYIEEALKIAKGNESKAAKLLNINHHTYRYRRKKLLGD
ncbi:MAG: sigma 54-interacting transcriptional regulator [Deltaproteobacteria bacterium]|nr:sigma 54-interacting transcriptional regulator [Deltaproteobacteria bacterium]